MYSILLHTDVFCPEEAQNAVLDLQKHMKDYFLSNHFKEHLDNQETEDRSHTYFKNAVINNLNEMISDSRRLTKAFEIELSKDYHFFNKPGWFVTKYCIRLPYSYSHDLVVVIRPQWDKVNQKYDASKNMIVTAWINHNKDDHKTLDSSKYCSKENWLKIK